MPIKTRNLEALLQKKFGFSQAKTRSIDHRWYELRIPGLPVILTKVSHGASEISGGLESMIARQLRVRRPFFLEMVGCTKDADAYRTQVQEDPYPPFDVGF